MSHPRISVFAGTAKGNVAAARVIEGQATLLARTSHRIAVDPIHDEIITSNPFSEAILFYRGGASGEEPPLRVIQGPKTKLGYTDNVAVDPQHGEVFTAQDRTNAVLVFSREAKGDVEPIRILHGPKTRLNEPSKVMVDYINNLLIVANGGEPEGLLIFNLTDNGDVAPRAIVSDPGIGELGGGSSRMALYPEGKKIFISLRGPGERTREDGGRGNSIGVWKYTTDGDLNVSLWAIIKDTATSHIGLGPVGLNPEAKEVMVLNKVHPPALHVYHVPEVFE